MVVVQNILFKCLFDFFRKLETIGVEQLDAVVVIGVVGCRYDDSG